MNPFLLILLLAGSAIVVGLQVRSRSFVARALAAMAIALPWACFVAVLWSAFTDALYTEKVASVLVDGQIGITEGAVFINELGRYEIAAVYEDESFNDFSLILPGFPAVRPLSTEFGITFLAAALLCFGVSSVPFGEVPGPRSSTIPAP